MGIHGEYKKKGAGLKAHPVLIHCSIKKRFMYRLPVPQTGYNLVYGNNHGLVAFQR
jgi:hypothetical protein